jgi:hypothetical protein
MTLANISDDTLLDEVKLLVGQEKKIIVEVIEYLKEIELRKLFLERGFRSMFVFATEYLGYSEAEAHIRLQAARLTQALPDVTSKIETGELNLSVAAHAQSQFRREDLRRKTDGEKPMTRDEKQQVLEMVSNCSRREAEEKLNTHFAGPSDSGKEMKFQASRDLQEKLEHLFDYFSHQNYERDLGKLIDIMADRCMKEIEKKYQPRVRKNPAPRASSVSAKPLRRSRFVSLRVKRLVIARTGGSCCHVDRRTGKRCSSRHGLEFDHIIPFALGGTNSADNITLLCDAHNRWKGGAGP